MEPKRIFAADRSSLRLILSDIRHLKREKALWKEIVGIKVGLLTILNHGLRSIKKIKQTAGCMILCDLKLADIPYISAEVAKLVARAGADAIVLQGFVGEKVIDDIMQAVPNLKIFLLSEMTHNNGGFTSEHMSEIAKIAQEKSVYAVIGPGNRPERISKLRVSVGPSTIVVAAGVSQQQHGSDVQAFKAGANIVIEGRRLLEKLDQKRRGFLRPVIGMIAYVLAGLVLSLLLIQIKDSMFATTPLVGVIIGTAFAIVGIVYQWWRA